MQKKYNRFKKLRIKVIKKRKGKKRKHRTAKANVEAELYDNNKKFD